MTVTITGNLAKLSGKAKSTLEQRYNLPGVVAGKIAILHRKGYKFSVRFLNHLSRTSALLLPETLIYSAQKF